MERARTARRRNPPVGTIVAAILVAVLVLVACAAPAGPSVEPEASGPIKAEIARSTSATVGMDGGTLTATAADGTAYTLEVPALAVAEPIEITMTPVRAIEGLPLSGGLAGAVSLEPSGTVLARSAILRITSTRTADADQVLAGFSASNDLSTRSLAPVAGSEGTISVLVSHFSAAGAGFGTAQDVAQWTVGSSASLDTYMSDVLAFPTPWDATLRQIGDEIAQDSFAQIVLPQLEDAADDFDLLTAVADYDHWRSLVDVILNEGEPVPWEPGEHFDAAQYADLRVQAASAAAPRLLEAVTRNAQVCGEQADVQALANALFWQGQTGSFEIDLPGSDLDLPNVLEEIRTHCAVVELIGSDLPAELPVGDPVDLEVGIGVRFANGDLKFTPAAVTLTSSDATIQGPNDTTDGAGLFHTTVTATASGVVTIHGHACIVLPVTFVTSPVCGDFDISSGSDSSPTAPPGGGGLLAGEWNIFLFNMAPGACPGFFQGSSGSATITQSGSLVQGTWTAKDCGGFDGSTGFELSGTFSGTLVIESDPAPGSFFKRLEGVVFTISASSEPGCFGPTTITVAGQSGIEDTPGVRQLIGIVLGEVSCNGRVVDGSVQLDRRTP